MSTIILASSGQFITGKNLNKYLPKKLKDCKIAFIITASKKARHLEYMARHRERMNKLKLNYTEMDIAKKTKTQLKKMLAGYDIILMGGGNTCYLLKCVRESEFAEVAKKLITKGVVYIGTSAGSYITCPSIVMATSVAKDGKRYRITDLTGMNFVPFLVKAHYTPDQLTRLKKQAADWPRPIYLLTDEQALVVKNGTVKFIGKGKKNIL